MGKKIFDIYHIIFTLPVFSATMNIRKILTFTMYHIILVSGNCGELVIYSEMSIQNLGALYIYIYKLAYS